MRDDVQFSWEREHEESFLKLKSLLSDVRHLSYFDSKKNTILVADASPYALGAVLLQEERDKYFVISYASKALTEQEQKYYQTEREALALVWACEKFSMYLTMFKFKLWTDCKALEYLFKHDSKPCARIQRWVLRLLEFDYEVIYKSGKMKIC